jgi:PIN domain nuclease of toxin-antitoxin system
LLVSTVSAFELSTKARLGKLDAAKPVLLAYAQYLDELGATELAVTSRHALVAGQLDWSHRDPFDRLLAAQALLEDATLVTRDAVFDELGGIHVERS